MANKKWRKPTKEEIKGAVQFALMAYMVAEGFFFTYTYIWFLVGFPQKWWAFLITTILGILSTGGLFTWIARN